jgi:hypothetical protein
MHPDTYPDIRILSGFICSDILLFQQDHGKWIHKKVTKKKASPSDLERLEPLITEVLEANNGYVFQDRAFYVKTIVDSG